MKRSEQKKTKSVSTSLYISENACNRCGDCANACGYKAISIVSGKVVIDREKCTLCMICLKVCPSNAIQLEKLTKDIDVTKYSGVWVLIEYINWQIHPGCFQILSKGYELAKTLTQTLTAVVIGNRFDDKEDIKAELMDYGVDRIMLLQCENIHTYQPEDVAEIFSREILMKKPNIVLFLGSTFGRELAPRVAAKIQTGLTADCTDLYINGEKNLVQVRPTYGGKILASIICPYDRPQMASVRPNVFERKKRNNVSADVPCSLSKIAISSVEGLKNIVETYRDLNRKKSIDDAEVIVCGGSGLGSKEGFILLDHLAEKIGGAVAGTRTAVDQGWIDFSYQIGQTGKTVRPRLYIACGVSGAIHHLIGMKHSGFIIAINTDPRAPIFKISDVGVVADLYEVVPKLIDKLEEGT